MPERTTTAWTPPLAESRLEKFAAGAKAPLHGIVFLRHHPALIRYAIWPFLINVAITMVLIAMLAMLSYWIFTSWHPWFSSSESSAGRVLWIILEIVIFAAIFVLCAVATVIVWHLANGILCGFFHGKLAEQVEIALGSDTSRFRSLTFGDEVAGTAFNVLLLIGGNLLSSSLNAIPIIGSLVAAGLSIYITGTVLGMDFLSYPLGLRGHRRWEQLAYARRHGSASLGLGGVVFISQLIPIFGAAILVSATVGAVLLYHRIEATSRTSAE